MNNRFEGLLEPYNGECADRRVLRLEASVIQRTNQEEEMNKPYVRVYDFRSRRRMVAQWPGGLNGLPERIVITCRRNGYAANLEARELIDCYLRSETEAENCLDIIDAYDESVRSRISLIVPEGSKDSFNGKLAENGYEFASGGAS